MAALWNVIGSEQVAQEYETRLKHLEKILDDEEQRKALVQSKGDDAQAWLDFLQLLSDYPGISIPLRSSVFSIIIRLAKNSGLHPKCLSIQNVKKVGKHPVGGGGFGDVWEGVVEDPTLKHSVCLKVVRMFRESNVERLLQNYLREAIVWRQLRHRNVLPFLGIYFLDESRQQVCLVSPWMEKGNLVQFLKTTPPEAVEHLALAHDVASGLAYLHYMKIAHGDLKGLNILITTALRACIADFGLSRVSDTNALRMTTSASHPLGTARWLSPELLQGGGLISKESDVYAYACVCYEIFTSLPPFHEIPNEMTVALQVLTGRRPLRPQGTPGIPDAMWSLMEECWAAEPSSRPRADDVLTRFAKTTKGDFTPIDPAPEWNDTIFTQMWSSVDRPSPSLTRPEFDRLLNMTPMIATQIVAQLPMPNPQQDVPERDGDADSDMILGEMEPEPTRESPSSSAAPPISAKPKQNEGVLRENIDEIVNDPLYGIRNRTQRADSQPVPSTQKSKDATSENPEKSARLMRERSIRADRKLKFADCLSSQDVSIAELRKLAWAGIPSEFRPMAWQLLLGYLPLPSPSRTSTLARKRNEYLLLVEVAFARDREGLDRQIWHQIEIDVPRTRPGARLWTYGTTQRSLERILYVWALRHPASGYVTGINDLATPFFQVFLSAYIESEPENFDPGLLPTNVLNAIEADSFWCLSRLLDGIQDNYIFAQPGIQRSVRRMAELVAHIDAPLYSHLEVQNVEFIQFAFRWMNCLLMREISVQNTIRMWDTYLAEGPDTFSQLHPYVCSVFLVKWSEKLRQMDFQGIIMFLQSLPTQDWGDHEIELLLSEAFVLNSFWHKAQSHFNGN